MRRTLEPLDFGVPVARPEDLKGGEVAQNVEIAMSVLGGGRGPHRDVVLVNSAAALVVAGVAETFLHGVALAAASIDSGAARGKAENLARYTCSL